MGRACRTQGVEEECLRGFGRKQGKRPRCRCEDNIKIDVKRNRVGVLWTGFIWLGIGTSGRPHKMFGNF
jgi:hypothetical protein